MRGVGLERLGDLDRQFARRRQHQRLRRGLFDIDARQHRQRKGGGLAGTGLGLAQHVEVSSSSGMVAWIGDGDS
jgi:hypothetical protein